jgi:CubicO group peptidase (beta-lactamase class C family)
MTEWVKARTNNLVLSLCLAGCAAQVVHAQDIDRRAVEVFFDEAWTNTLRMGGLVPGAVITVVHDGEVILNRGYGVRDIGTGGPVDPENTRLRIGSTSKLFSALTALALADAGKIALDRNVNDYLKTVKVPDTFAEPITLRTLLSHRAGFDASVSGFMRHDRTHITTSPDTYERHLRRAHPPNHEVGYDNLAAGLMGYLAGELNGTSFARAVEEKVIVPWGLTKTTVGVPDSQFEHLAACHTWDSNGQITTCTPKFMREGYQAAGDITSTGADIARFMLALLDGGCLDSKCVLKAQTFSQFTDLNANRVHPLAYGMGFIVYEKRAAGRLAMGHDGGQDGFTTSLILFPETRTGVFINLFSYVGLPNDWDLSSVIDLFRRVRDHDLAGAQTEIEVRFAETFLPPRTAPAPRRPEGPIETDLGFLSGTYVGTPTQGNTAMLLSKLANVATAMSVVATGDGVFVNGVGPFRHTGGGVLEMNGENAKWLFTRIGDDVILQKSDALAFKMYVKKPWHWAPIATLLPLVLPVLLAIPAFVFGLVQRRSKPGRNLGYLLAFSGLAALLGIYLELEYYAANYFENGPTVALFGWRLLLNLSWVAAIAALYLIVVHPRQLLGIRGFASLGRSLFVALLALSAITVVVLLPYWGLVGIRV